jgi:acyltransferase
VNDRIEWIDNAKAIGIFLVFYGHYIESLSAVESHTEFAFEQFKIIYSFHMPLFFILSGFFSKKQENKLMHINKLFLQRLLPVLSFAILFIPLWMINNFIGKKEIMFFQIIEYGLSYFRGIPRLNFITWFLICLFSAEVICTIFGLISKKKWINLISGFCFVIFGHLFVENFAKISNYSISDLNYWYLPESIVAIGFYLIGNCVFSIINNLKISKISWMFSIAMGFIIFIVSSNLTKNNSVVIMAISQHGELIPFIVNSLLGSLIIIGIANVIPSNKLFNFYGSNTLILLGLNGFFFHFLNSEIAEWTLINTSFWFITLNCFVFSIISLAVCYPIIIVINKYIPQLFGKPYLHGPLIGSLNYFSLSSLSLKIKSYFKTYK